MLASLPAVLALAVSVPLFFQAAAEDRLLQGELLEVSSGDLEKAMAIYQALQADEKTPEPTRARALLCLARCQRKRGELDAAKKTLDSLIRTHANEQDILRQARSFLAELESGRAANPEFDWLKELEKSPEIQARVFDLTMDLMSAQYEKSSSAQRQLLALGSISAPAMERMLELSRDSVQRQRLALVLIGCGRYERVAAILDPAQAGFRQDGKILVQLVEMVSNLNEDGRRGMLAALEKLPAQKETENERSLLRLAAGDRANVEALIRSTEEIPRWTGAPWSSQRTAIDDTIQTLLARLVRKDPRVAEVLSSRFLDPACPIDVQEEYIKIFKEDAPSKLAAERWKTFVEKWVESGRVLNGKIDLDSKLRDLEKALRFDVLLLLAQGPVSDRLGEWFAGRLHNNEDYQALPEGLGKVLRFIRPRFTLQNYAATHESALPELVDFLRHRDSEDPSFRGFLVPWKGEGPSTAYFAALSGLLDDKDPVTVAIALQALLLAPDRNPPGTAAKLESVALHHEDGRVREIALLALIGSLNTDPRPAPAAAAALLHEAKLRAEAGETPESYLASPLAKIGAIGSLILPPVQEAAAESPRRPSGQRVQRVIAAARPRTQEAPLKPSYLARMQWVLDSLSAGALLALYPRVLEIADSAAGARLHDMMLRFDDPRWWVLLNERLASIQSAELLESAARALSILAGLPKADPPRLDGQFLRRICEDPRISLEVKVRALYTAPDATFDAFDWPKLLAVDDPIVAHLVWGTLPEGGGRNEQGSSDRAERIWELLRAKPSGEWIAALRAGLSSPVRDVVEQTVRHLPRDLPETADLFRVALRHPDSEIRTVALKRLESATRSDVGPLYVELLSHEDQQCRIAAADRLPKFASVESIEPLTKMLDDSDVEVRDHALNALKKLRSALEEKKEWQELVKKLNSKAEGAPR